MSSTILNVFPGSCDGHRLVLAREADAHERPVLVLRQETRSPHVGWFVQSRIVIEPNQVSALKMTLTSNLVQQPTEELPVSESAPSVLRFDAAMAG